MKRSSRIRLVLIGSLSAGSFTGCNPDSQPLAVSLSHVYTNNYHLPGVGYYHAPYQGWYSAPYNHYDAGRRQYFHGGQWTDAPHQSITNISSPTPAMAQQAHSKRADVARAGFGSTSRHYSTYS